MTPSLIYPTCNYIYSEAASSTREKEGEVKGSQVLWEDPKEVEERKKLLEKMKSMEKNLQTLPESDQDASGKETQSSFEILEAEEDLGLVRTAEADYILDV